MSLDEKFLFEDLGNRIILLSRGILPPLINGKPMKYFHNPGLGPGPQGRKFYISSRDNRPLGMISVPIFPHEHHLARYASKTFLGEIPGTIVAENGCVLKSCMTPEFLKMKFRDGTPFVDEGIAMIHCYNTCTSVMGFKCKHFDNGEECRYCEIEPVGKGLKGFPPRQSIEHFVEAVQAAKNTENIRTLTITSGTFDEPDEVALYYLKLLTELRKIKDLSIHIQIEPLTDMTLLKKLSELSDSIGIFLEIFDEKIRKEVCPGKSKVGKEEYIKNWEEAVKCYGKGNVGTTCLLGFDVDYNEILKNVEDFAKIGVKTSLMFTRFNSKTLNDEVPSYLKKDTREIVDLFMKTANILSKYDLCFAKNTSSGCLACQGCTAMHEACEIVSAG